MSHVCLYQATWQNDFIKSSLCESTPSTTILLFHHALYTLLRNNNKHDPALVRGLPVYSRIIDIVLVQPAEVTTFLRTIIYKNIYKDKFLHG